MSQNHLNDYIVQAVHSARCSFNSGKNRRVTDRRVHLRRLLAFYTEREQELIDCLKQDLGKHYFEAVVTEISHLQRDCRLMISKLDEWTRPIPVKRSVATVMDNVYLKPDPYGVVLIMGAWNYPLQLTMLPVAAAIAAGNCVVIKPPDLTPATAAFLRHVLPEYLDPACFPVVCGGAERCQRLLEQRFDYILYTGGGAVGRLVHAAANRHLTPVTLELGGKSPVYLDDSVNMEYAAKRIIWGKMVNLGQTCIAPDYILCSKAAEKLFLHHSSRAIQQWLGKKALHSEYLGRIVNGKHFKRLIGLLESTEGRLAIGGSYCAKSRKLEPTVVTHLSVDDALMKEEIFGPILPIVNVESPEEAIKLINSRERPLVLYVFSRRSKVVHQLSTRTHSGGICVNDVLMHYTVDQLPFGGVGKSGMGAIHGKASFDTFTHYRSVLHRSFNPIVETFTRLRYPPYTANKLCMIKLLLRNHQLPDLSLLKHLLLLSTGALIMHLANYLTQSEQC